MKRVLLPTDFSDNARSAIEYAIGMFSYIEVQYVLLNTYSEPHSNHEMMVSITDLLQSESIQGLNREKEYFCGKYSSDLLDLEIRSEYGDLSYVINRIVESDKIDFVVMGTTGATGLKKMLTGSNAADVVKKARCPVFAIPEGVRYTPPDHIALATDTETFSDISVFSLLKEIVDQYQSGLTVVNIQPEVAMTEVCRVGDIRLQQVLKSIPHDYFHIEHNNVLEGLIRFVSEHEIDLLVMLAHQHTLFQRVFRLSLTKQMSMLTRIPLLVLHEK